MEKDWSWKPLFRAGREPKEQGSERASQVWRRGTFWHLDICRMWQVIWDCGNKNTKGKFKKCLKIQIIWKDTLLLYCGA